MKYCLIKQINSFHSELPAILALSVGNCTQEKLNIILNDYTKKNLYICGVFINEKLIAMIGFSLNNNEATIEHIGVASEHRRSGIGKELINFVANNFHIKTLKAETDDEAIAFYHALGFTSISFVNKYGVVRYKCKSNL